MKKLKPPIIFSLLLTAIFLQLFLTSVIQAKRLPIKIYTSADGLGSSFVDYLMRDSRGFMWFCTRDGLSRFDGSRFVTYQIGDKNAPPGIESIYETRAGIYWITTTGGTYRFNPNDISPPDAVNPKLNVEFVTAERGQIFEDYAGTLWFITTSGLSRLEQKDGKEIFEKVELDLSPKSNSGFVISDITEANDHSLWLNTSRGVVRRLPDNRIVFYPNEAPLSSGNSSMIADSGGRIWVTQSNKILVIKPEPIESFTGSERQITKTLDATSFVELKSEGPALMPQKDGEIFQYTNSDLNRFVENSYAKRLFQTSDGDVWITAENNLMQFSKGGFYLHTSAEGLPNVMARLAEDAAGNLWIGGHAGLARLDRQGVVTFGMADGANSARFFAINEDADGTMYFAGRDFYLSRFDGSKLQTIRPVIDDNSAYLWTSRFALRASDGDWWILTNQKLYRFANKPDFAELDGAKPTKTYTQADGLKSDAMFQIFEDSAENIWVSTRTAGGEGTGVSRLKKGEEKFQTFTEAEGLPSETGFSSAAEDSAGNIWFSFYEGGIARFDGAKFDYFGEKDGLPKGSLPDIHLDKKGRLWTVSALGGLIRVDDPAAKTPVFTYITTANGLTSNNIRTITEDHFGRLYIGTARGVDRYSPETGRVKHYSVNDGLAADFVVDSHCDKNGNLWFATNDGLSRLVPLPDETADSPRILIGGLQIAGVEQAISQLGNTEIKTGELADNQNNFQIDFYGLDFRAGESLRYQYKLEGSNADWSQPTEQRTVTYANLSPGSYRFLVRSVNSEGVTSENPAVVSFKILPPIYLRWWFITALVVALALIIFSSYRYRISNLRAINQALTEAKSAEENLRKSREERLAELENVRSRIATDLHDDIGASLTQIAILSEVAQAQSKGNGASESLSKISNVSNELVGTMSDIVWSINPAKDHLSDLTQRMRRFASDSLSAKGISFHFNSSDVDQEITVKSNLRREVFLIFKESINNIVKHSEARQVKIKLQISLEDLTLEITDDGKGFEAEKAYENSLSSISMGRNGILSMQKRAKEMNGELEVISELGKGTTVELKLPMELGQTQMPNR